MSGELKKKTSHAIDWSKEPFGFVAFAMSHLITVDLKMSNVTLLLCCIYTENDWLSIALSRPSVNVG